MDVTGKGKNMTATEEIGRSLQTFIAKVNSDEIPPYAKSAGRCIAEALAVYQFVVEVATRSKENPDQELDIQEPMQEFLNATFAIFDSKEHLLQSIEEMSIMMGFLPSKGEPQK